MAKLTLSDLANLQNETTAVTAINANSALIETAMENTLSRDGTSPNTMSASLDMNSNKILNLPNAILAQEPVTLAQFEAGVATSGAAPSTSQYVTLAATTGLSAERVLTAGTGISLADAGAGSTITINSTTTSSAALAALISDETGTGTVVFGTSPSFTTSILPISNDGCAIGTGTLSFSDLFLASGGVINFNNGDVSVTHAANELRFTGASIGYSFDALVFPSANNTIALGNGNQQWADIFLGDGAVVNFNNGDVTLTHSSNFLTLAGGTLAVIQSGIGTGFVLQLSEDSATAGPFFQFERISASPAVNDAIGAFQFTGRNSSAGSINYAYINGRIADPTAASEDGVVDIYTYLAGTLSIALNVGPGLRVSTTVNGAPPAQGHLLVDGTTASTSSTTGSGVFAGGIGVAGTSYFATTLTSGTHVPVTSDGGALGTTALMWSDLFLASGGVINFDNSDVILTHTANRITFSGASSGWVFSEFVAPTTDDAAPLGAGTQAWSDLFLASGAVINFNNGNITLTHASGVLTLGGGNLAISAGYLDLTEIVSPATPSANVARFYSKDNGSGTTLLYFKDAAGTESQLAAGGGGSYNLLTSGTVSAATLDIVLTGYTAYRGLKIFLSGFMPATDDVELWLRMSTDGGSTYDAGAASYAWGHQGVSGNTSDFSDSEIVIAGGASANNAVGNASTEGVNCEITILNQTSTSHYARVAYQSQWMDAGGTPWWVHGGGMWLGAQDCDAIRFLFESGNISTGKYAVYGLA